MQLETITYTPEDRRKRLTHLEGVIKKGLKAYEQVGAALEEIKRRQLFMPPYGSFGEYCTAKSMTERHANRYIRAAQAAATLRKQGIEIGNEAQAREMARLLDAADVETAVRVWKEVGEALSGKRTYEALQEAIDKELGVERKTTDVHFSSESSEWYTPDHIIERVQRALGGIDLDPCAEEEKGVPATTYYTIEQNGLKKKWHGRVYMNPPYGDEIDAWVKKLIKEYESGRTTAAIALLPARTDTKWYRVLKKFPRCHYWGRVRFKNSKSSAPFPSAAVYLGDDEDAFVWAFESAGDVYVPREGTIDLPENLTPDEAKEVLKNYSSTKYKYPEDAKPEQMTSTENAARRAKKVREKAEARAKRPLLVGTGSANIQIHHCEISNLAKYVDEHSVDLILTDPPYAEKHLPLFSALGEFAKYALKPTGALVSYMGNYHAPKAANRIMEHVPYYWQMIVMHREKPTAHDKGLLIDHKPVGIFGEPGERMEGRAEPSIIGGGGGDKEHHDWGQPIDEAVHFIEMLTEPGELVVDPFVGGGTTAAAAKRLGRRCIAAEKDFDTYQDALERVQAEPKPKFPGVLVSAAPKEGDELVVEPTDTERLLRILEAVEGVPGTRQGMLVLRAQDVA